MRDDHTVLFQTVSGKGRSPGKDQFFLFNFQFFKQLEAHGVGLSKV